ncbi:MAG TPA: radical SAM family heme chaperone HemW [Candidatus Dormibacteraeota bacterium]|nr:radical SAM family heme chaperone HemW [Candidatus Dormibacteraeota bacterium]
MTGPALRPFRHLYVHVPFCRHKCGYCDFNAYAGMDRLMPDYQAALERELERARTALPFEPLRSVYFGGGTPSLLSAELAARMLAHVASVFELEPGAEITLEANPASTDPDKLAAWRVGRVNRLSLGVQGFDTRALAVLERRSDGAQAERAYRQAREAGFAEISLDLIYGVPFQAAVAWTDTVARAIALGPEHLSCYCLTFEAGTLLTRRRDRGRLPEVDADTQWEQLDEADRLLSAAGYERYEVSSWARPGHQARHNHAYWDCRPVYGAGAGAHSYATDGERAWRWWNVARPRDYIAAAAAPDAPVELDREELDQARARAERVMLGLRTTAGLEPPPGFETALAQLEAAGLVIRHGARCAPTRRGLDLHNQIALAVL